MNGVGRAAAITVGAAAGAVVVDRALKEAVERSLDEGDRISGPLGTAIVRRTNPYGVNGTRPGSGTDTALIAAGGALALGIAAAGAFVHAPLAVRVGAGLVAGGMAGNLVDRARGGGVTDFLVTPAGVVNAADLAIGTGIVLAGAGLLLR